MHGATGTVGGDDEGRGIGDGDISATGNTGNRGWVDGHGNALDGEGRGGTGGLCRGYGGGCGIG
ncbi:MAG TPA: hypothetical protein VEU97_11985, partial [Ktedonobacteraceae bacterium]|nr:hypothetical protein [Ktedonobacteraceae bacterium]